MSSIVEICQADWADIWHTGSLTISARHWPVFGVTLQPVRLKTAKCNCMGCIDSWFQVVWEFEGPLDGWVSGCFNQTFCSQFP